MQQKKVGAEKNKLVPTPLGRSVLDFLLQHFDDLFSYNFTGELEHRLDSVADGTQSWKDVVKDTWESYKDRYQLLNEKRATSEKREEKGVSPKIKEFSNGLKAVQSKKGPLLLIEGTTKEDTRFLGWPDRVTWDQMTEEVAQQFVQTATAKLVIGEWNGRPMERKSGKFGD
jgi:DNA topoisomerase-1